MNFLTLFLAATITIHQPNHTVTPGAINNLTAAQLCSVGFSTKSLRPPVSYTNKLKIQMMTQYHLSGKPSDYELDHLISLELGGDPKSIKNLWMQPWPEARMKDKVENYLHREVCAGHITLREAQKEISTDWYAVYVRIK